MSLSDPLDLMGRSNAHTHPMYDFLTGFMPRKLKDLFRWCEYLYYRSPQIFRAAQRLADYVITEVIFSTDNEREQEQYENLLLEHVGIMSALKTAARDRVIYGNGFYSMFFPSKKMIACAGCSTEFDLTKLDFEYDGKKMTFAVICPKCGKNTKHPAESIVERKSYDKSAIRVIAWDPKLMDIEYNPVSGKSRFFYNIPTSVRTEVERNNQWFISQLPIGFLRAVSLNQVFEFAPGAIFQLKEEGPSGMQSQWGIPPLASVMKDFFYAGVLRKANEAIALEYTVPFRVLSPDVGGGGGSLIQYLNITNWKENTMSEVRKWRRDPLHMMFAPVPLQVTQMGGQARSLLATPEVEQAENNIMAGIGIPREFVYGGLQFTGSSVTLRMLENQLLNDRRDLIRLAKWVTDRCRRHMGWGHVGVDLKSFRFVDDVAQKGMLLQADAQYQLMSKGTVAELFDLDLKREGERKVQEQIDDMALQTRMAQKQQETTGTLLQQTRDEASQMAQQQAGQGQALPPEDAFITMAQQMVPQLLAMEEGDRQSQMYGLRGQSLVLYSLVTEMLQEQDRAAKQQVSSQVKQEAVAQ